jgi:tRNA(Arg) A34 adenosine deaminase TadA
MSKRRRINRRDFLVRTAGAAGAVSALAGTALKPAHSQTCPPVPVIDPNEPLAHYWQKQVCELADVDFKAASPELTNPAVMERHRIYCLLLMKLIHRFWNGNKRGPLGVYPLRAEQKEQGQDPSAKAFRYRGDMFKSPDPLRVNWDRYLGHNIACIAVDGKGEVIDFDFNHNDFFRSSAEHAESRMVRRLFSLTDVFDKWRTGEPIPGKSRAVSLRDVTLYTSLESCAQCSGVMSLAQVKQVVYLQRDYTAYVIGNLMFNLAPGVTPIPIPAAKIDLPYFDKLNGALKTFNDDMLAAKSKDDQARAFFISPDGGTVDYSPSITSFLCTDTAFKIFAEGSAELDRLTLAHADETYPNDPERWSNGKCLHEVRRFYEYADVEGYRGSPHKL